MLSTLKTGHEFYRRIWRPAEVVVSDMEERGVGLDVALCPVKHAETQLELVELESALKAWTGQTLNWGSPKQLAQFLYGTSPAPAVKGGPDIVPLGLTLPPVKGTLRAVQARYDGDDEPSTGGAALRYLADHGTSRNREGLENLLAWKDKAKLGSFWATLPNHTGADGRIHPQLGPDTETGRLSCKNPNLQQQPPATRAAFVASPGKVLIELDYDALEWRILAHVLAHWCGDTSLADEVREGIDPHSATAGRMADLGVAFPEARGVPIGEIKKRFPDPRGPRGASKILNYSTIYMKTGAGLGAQMGIGAAAGEELLAGFFEARPGVAKFHHKIVKLVEATGGVRSLLGRRRPIDAPLKYYSHRLGREVWGPGARQAANVIQNCAADIVTLAMLRVNTNPELAPLGWYHRGLADLRCDLILQIHDSLLFEVPEENATEARELAARAMETCLDGVRDFKCPLGVSGGIGPNWGSCK